MLASASALVAAKTKRLSTYITIAVPCGTAMVTSASNISATTDEAADPCEIPWLAAIRTRRR